MELVWPDVKNALARNYANFSLDKKIIIILKKLFSEITAAKWQKCDDHVRKIEEEYWHHDTKFDQIMDEIIINLNDDSDSSDKYESSSSSSSLHSKQSGCGRQSRVCGSLHKSSLFLFEIIPIRKL